MLETEEYRSTSAIYTFYTYLSTPFLNSIVLSLGLICCSSLNRHSVDDRGVRPTTRKTNKTEIASKKMSPHLDHGRLASWINHIWILKLLQNLLDLVMITG